VRFFFQIIPSLDERNVFSVFLSNYCSKKIPNLQRHPFPIPTSLRADNGWAKRPNGKIASVVVVAEVQAARAAHGPPIRRWPPPSTSALSTRSPSVLQQQTRRPAGCPSQNPEHGGGAAASHCSSAPRRHPLPRLPRHRTGAAPRHLQRRSGRSGSPERPRVGQGRARSRCSGSSPAPRPRPFASSWTNRAPSSTPSTRASSWYAASPPSPSSTHVKG
jgi:hypothetical protein